MSDEDENKPRHAKIYRLVPQLKTFKEGTVLKTKMDLYYSQEEDILETGGEDNWSPVAGLGALTPQPVAGPQQPGATPPVVALPPPSFSQSSDFIHKEATVMFVEAAQFRADDNRVYVRAHLIHGEKVVWVNLLRVPQRRWGYMIRSEQKDMIKEEMSNMFESNMFDILE